MGECLQLREDMERIFLQWKNAEALGIQLSAIYWNVMSVIHLNYIIPWILSQLESCKEIQFKNIRKETKVTTLSLEVIQLEQR